MEDKQGRTGVHLACMRDHDGIVQSLVQRGMELDIGDRMGKTPAHYAAKYGSLACLECLAKNTVDLTMCKSLLIMAS